MALPDRLSARLAAYGFWREKYHQAFLHQTSPMRQLEHTPKNLPLRFNTKTKITRQLAARPKAHTKTHTHITKRRWRSTQLEMYVEQIHPNSHHLNNLTSRPKTATSVVLPAA